MVCFLVYSVHNSPPEFTLEINNILGENKSVEEQVTWRENHKKCKYYNGFSEG